MHSLLVIGGARSGKSRYAQARAEATGLAPIYIATAQAFDDEMHDRISRHRADRGAEWTTVEAPMDLAGAIATWSSADRIILIDCLTLWVSNLMLAERDIGAALRDLIGAVSAARSSIILVANEVGLGIVPDNPLARRFRDEAGFVNQHIAELAEEVQFICAGLSVQMK